MLVIPGSEPCFHVAPPSVEVAQPISDAPPSSKRPCWNVATSVEPYDATSGSTSGLCWLDVWLNGSTLSLRNFTPPFFAATGGGTAPARITCSGVAALAGAHMR